MPKKMRVPALPRFFSALESVSFTMHPPNPHSEPLLSEVPSFSFFDFHSFLTLYLQNTNQPLALITSWNPVFTASPLSSSISLHEMPQGVGRQGSRRLAIRLMTDHDRTQTLQQSSLVSTSGAALQHFGQGVFRPP
ncbi:unnamed protein product [Cyclocybe aegerita]|uniref:Uncharacterized protein n=1 Tax=Cyclocybe aegerita TaxID=1973307 RepID=A0A8S0XH93_CYCAE|nr:unnamed protein product [Cyclocybe aegerita]